MTGRAAQLEGSRFSRLAVLGRVGSKYNGQALWKCLCDCGNYHEVTTHSLRRGQTKSCGCLRTERNREPHAPTYILPVGQSAKNKLMTAYKRSAALRNKLFLLTEGQSTKYFGGNCFYCGAEPSNTSKTKGGDYIYNGIDRIDNNLDYVVENCVSCCKVCNSMKSKMDAVDFLDHVKRIAKRNNNV